MTCASPGLNGPRLRLHYNENTAGCSPMVIAALQALTPQEIASYPDVTPFTARAARHLNVPPDRVQLINGLDEGIQVVTTWAQRNSVTNQPPVMVLPEPAFEMYAEFGRMAGAHLISIPPEAGFRFPLEAVLATIDAATRVVFLTDPNNPTGLGIPEGCVETIASAAPGALVFVDEAYADFSGRTLIGPLLDRRPNVVIGRTFAKGHGLAGLRIGALVAHEDTLAGLRSLLPPFNVNICALRGMAAALDDPEYLAWYVAQTAASRQLVYAFCERHGLGYWPSEANFVLICVGSRAGSLADRLEASGISVRDKSNAPGCEGCIRLTAGVVAHTNAAIAAMEEILASRDH
ncbi:MAG: histidinol-phosphate transaminase [Vicinamibacterales bacterium]